MFQTDPSSRGEWPRAAAPVAIILTRLSTGLAALGHPDRLGTQQLEELAEETRLPLVAGVDGEHVVADVNGRLVRFNAHTAVIPGADPVIIGARQSPHALAAQQVIDDLLGTTPIRVALSGGKDSSVVMALVINAARRRAQAGAPVAPIHVTSADTGVESPEVMAQVAAIHRSLHTYADTLGIELHLHTTQPNPMERWWPRMLAGRKLPAYAGAQADCTTDLKIKPQQRLAKRIADDLRANGWPEMVTLTGLRTSESVRRSAHMAERGDHASVVVNGMLAPIANWTDAMVFDFLGDATERKFPHDWAGLLKFYADASSECVLAPDPVLAATASRCGTRSGCFVCQQVADDHSAAVLSEQQGYEHLQPLVRLNRFLRAIRWDFSRRYWLGRNIDPLTGHLVVHPNCFNFETCDQLLRMLLTLDCEEHERAQSVADALQSGALPDTPRNRRMAEPQFTNLTFDDVVMIDYLRSIDGFGPEHSALLAFQDVVLDGQRFPVPEMDPMPRQALPAPRYVALDAAALRAYDTGLRDVDAMFAEVDDPLVEDAVSGRASIRHPNESEEPTFTIDGEAVELFFQFEFDERVRLARSELPVCAAARFYLQLGTIRIPRGRSNETDAQIRRTGAKVRAGLRWNTGLAELQTIDARTHDAKRQAVAIEVLGPWPVDKTHLDRERTNREVEAAHSQEPPPTAIDLVLKREAIRLAIAGGVVRFDGRNLHDDVRRIEAMLRAEARRSGPVPEQVVSTAIAQLMADAERIQQGERPERTCPVELWLPGLRARDSRSPQQVFAFWG